MHTGFTAILANIYIYLLLESATIFLYKRCPLGIPHAKICMLKLDLNEMKSNIFHPFSPERRHAKILPIIDLETRKHKIPRPSVSFII